VRLLRKAAIARGISRGVGEAAPLATMTEHFHGITNAQMGVELAAISKEALDKLAQSDALEAAKPLQGGITEATLRVNAAAMRARNIHLAATP
jgi:hypothetical protein